LYGTIKFSGYANIEGLINSSPYMSKNGHRYLKRLSEVRNHRQTRTDMSSLENINRYNETMLFSHLFGSDKNFPPAQIEVYRGVPRADAQLRPGDYVTTSRSYARYYMSGKMGAIIRQVVNTDDLLLMKLDNPDILEFVYYPKSAMKSQLPTSDDVKPPFTFRQFFNDVNGIDI
jgi:hypothetical protein